MPERDSIMSILGLDRVSYETLRCRLCVAMAGGVGGVESWGVMLNLESITNNFAGAPATTPKET